MFHARVDPDLELFFPQTFLFLSDHHHKVFLTMILEAFEQL